MSKPNRKSSSNFSKPPVGDAKSGSPHIKPSGGDFKPPAGDAKSGSSHIKPSGGDFKPPAGDAKSGSSHIKPSGGDFAGGGQELPLSPLAYNIVKRIKKRAKEAGVSVPPEVAVDFAKDYASRQSKKKNRDFNDADVAEAVAIFEGQYKPPAPQAVGGDFAGGGQELPLSPLADYIIKGIKERAKEAGVFVPPEVAVDFAKDYASRQSKRKNRDFNDADVKEAVAIFEEQYEPPESPAVGGVAGGEHATLLDNFVKAIVSAIFNWRPTAGHFIPDQIVIEFANSYASEHPPQSKKKFKQPEVDCALQLFMEQQEQWLQQREHERQQREQREQEQREQREQEQREQEQRRQQQQPEKPKPVKKPVIQAGSLLAVAASKSKRCQKNNEVPMAIPEEREYARVHRKLGDRRFIAEILSSGNFVQCRLAGAMPKDRDNRVNLEDYVLVDMRTYESTSTVQQPGGTIVFKYSPQEIRTLQKMGELSDRCSSQLETSSVCFVRTENFDKVVTNVQIGYDWDFPPSDSEDDE
jgi:hypothetical protein